MFRDIVKYGWDNIKHEVLFDNLTEEEARSIETALIKENVNGYNRPIGGNGKKAVICVETGEIYESITVAMKAIDIKGYGAFYKALNKPNRTCGGYHWSSI